MYAFDDRIRRYNDRPAIAAEATFRAGMAYWKQAKKAEYDQGAAASAIATFTDFVTLYPNDPRVKQTQKLMDDLRGEQARGNFEIAKFYENKKKFQGAVIYYNEVLLLDPTSKLANDVALYAVLAHQPSSCCFATTYQCAIGQQDSR